jgi:hypothetical protein
MPTVTAIPAELAWRRANITRTVPGSDTVNHRRVRLVVDGDHARIFESDGSLTLDTRFVSGEMHGKVLTLETENGQSWTATRTGCNCGG